ncbi:MAG TPA: TonB family protein [Vicinamibacterales bacterium]|jgi:protein TonB|nr:TonB family protein [Vicinamibacterales bacterium]
MADDLFGGVSHAAHLGSRRWYTLPLSIAAHAAALAAVLVIPLMATGDLPAIRRAITFGDIEIMPVAPPPPRLRAARPPGAPVNAPARDVAPLEPPSQIGPERLDSIGSAIEIEGDPNGVDGGIPIDSDRTFVPPPPPPPLEPPTKPIRPGGKIVVPQRVVYAQPVYPSIAQSAGIEGRVVIEAIVGPSGEVTNVRVVKSVRFLDDSALAAVRQWKYTPTLLNGTPVSVLLTVSVDFRLSR